MDLTTEEPKAEQTNEDARRKKSKPRSGEPVAAPKFAEVSELAEKFAGETEAETRAIEQKLAPRRRERKRNERSVIQKRLDNLASFGINADSVAKYERERVINKLEAHVLRECLKPLSLVKIVDTSGVVRDPVILQKFYRQAIANIRAHESKEEHRRRLRLS